MDLHARIYVAGGSGSRGQGTQATMTGAAILRRLAELGFTNVAGAGDDAPDLLDRTAVDTFFDKVMVNTEDADLRANRLALLAQLRQEMNRVADISKLAT